MFAVRSPNAGDFGDHRALRRPPRLCRGSRLQWSLRSAGTDRPPPQPRAWKGRRARRQLPEGLRTRLRAPSMPALHRRRRSSVEGGAWVQRRNATKRARTGKVYPERGENAPKRPEKARWEASTGERTADSVASTRKYRSRTAADHKMVVPGHWPGSPSVLRVQVTVQWPVSPSGCWRGAERCEIETPIRPWPLTTDKGNGLDSPTGDCRSTVWLHPSLRG